jgi:stage II sporulation protein E
MEKRGYSYFGDGVAADSIPPRLNRGALPRKNPTLGKKSKSPALNTIIILISCFFIGRAFIFDNIAPFGVALFTVMLIREKGKIIAFIAILGGMLSVNIGGEIVKNIGAMGLILLVYNMLGKIRAGQSRFLLASLATTMIILVNLIYKGLAPGGLLSYDYILTILEGAIVFVLVYVFDNVLSLILDVKRRRILSNEEIISMGIFAGLLIVGLWDIKIYSLSIRNILSVLFITIAAHIGGIGVGTAVGILMGLVLTMASGPDPTLIALLGVCGLVAGTFRNLGKIFTGFTFLLANALMSFYINQSTVTILSFREILVSIGLLILIPRKAFNTMRQFLDYSLMRYKEQNFYIKRMQELTVERLNEFAGVFKELAAAFGEVSHGAKTGQDDIAKLFDIISSQVCSSCPLYGSCWERDFSGTYNGMFNIITTIESRGSIEKADIRGELSKHCIHLDRLIDSIQQVYGLYKSNLKWRSKIDECRQLVAQQLDGVSGVVGQLAQELDIRIDFKKDLEETISLELDKAGIRVKEVLVMEKSDGSIEINIHKNSCNGRRDCTRKVQRMVSKIIGRRMAIDQSPCTGISKGECILKLVDAMEFQVSTGVARKPGQSGGICGDSYSFNGVAHGKYMLALSDGMGLGEKAANESGVVISLLENFLEAGFDMDTIIPTINSTLLLRSQDEIFATLDLCLLDLVSGDADFVKIGAVSTFIKRRNYVEVVKASSLPIGILENIQLETASLKLYDEDMIVMITDGVLDNASKGEKAEEWLVEVIDALDTRNPQEMADHIMESVLKTGRFTPTTDFKAPPTDGSPVPSRHFVDDMTVMVTRIYKPVGS